jgi:outer membrane protein TolC
VKTAMGGAEGMYAYGFAEKLDLDRLTVTYNNLLIEKEKTQRLVLLSRYLLRYQMGIDVNTNVQLTDKLEDVKFDVAANANAEKFDYNKRVEYGLYETQKKLNELDLKKTKFAFLPTAVLYGNISGYGYSKGYNSNQDYFINHRLYPSTFIGAKVTMPIFTGFQRNSRTQQAKLNLQKAQNNIESLKKSIDLELASSMTMLQNAAVSLDNQKKNITLAEEVYRITKYKYEQGVGTNLEMVTAETSLKEAQTNYYNALYDAIVAKIDYDKANGNLKY